MSETTFVIEPGRHDIVMTREFDAPRAVVFDVITDPSLIPNWYGPAVYETTVEHADIRTGGSWHYVSRGQGEEHGFRGVFHDVSAPDRVVQTFEYLGTPGHVCLETATLAELAGGRTRYTAVSVFQSVEDRDAMAASGMESGAAETMDRLAAILAERTAG